MQRLLLRKVMWSIALIFAAEVQEAGATVPLWKCLFLAEQADLEAVIRMSAGTGFCRQ